MNPNEVLRIVDAIHRDKNVEKEVVAGRRVAERIEILEADIRPIVLHDSPLVTDSAAASREVLRKEVFVRNALGHTAATGKRISPALHIRG